MLRIQRVSVALLLTSLLLFGVSGTIFAAHPAKKKAKTDTLVVQILPSGKRVGTISGGVSCAKAKCTFKVKAGSKETLTEKPKNAKKTPFKHWTVGGKMMGAKKTVSFTVNKKSLTVQAVYK